MAGVRTAGVGSAKMEYGKCKKCGGLRLECWEVRSWSVEV